MSTEQIVRLATQLWRRPVRVEWQRVVRDGGASIVAAVLTTDADGDHICTSEVGATVGAVLDRLQARLAANVARLPDSLADHKRVLWAWTSALATKERALYALAERHFTLAACFKAAAKGFRPHG